MIHRLSGSSTGISSIGFPIELHITNLSKTQVAVIGSGMAGLSAAWMLSQAGFRVTVFEKGPRPGLSAHSRDFSQFIPEVANELPGDVPSRMFNDSLWPSVTKIYRDAGVEFEPVDHQQTFFHNDEVLLKIGLPYTTTVIKNVFNPVARRLIGSLATFQKTGLAELESGDADSQTFGDFVDRQIHDCLLYTSPSPRDRG